MHLYLPWRLRWAASRLAGSEFWRAYFAATRPTARLRSLAVLASAFCRRAQPRSSEPVSLSLELEQVGRVYIDGFSDFFIFSEIFVERCYDLDLASDAPSILDVGANVGFFALRMKQLYPQAQVWCFEPFSANYRRLVRNLETAGVGDVATYRLAVGGAAGEVPLYLHPSNSGGHSIFVSESQSSAPSAGREVGQEMVEVVTLRDALDLVPHGVADLVKLDCEGAEGDIILGMTEKEAARIACIVYEPTGRLYDPRGLRRHLERLGYHCRVRQGLTIATRIHAPSAA